MSLVEAHQKAANLFLSFYNPTVKNSFAMISN